MARVTLVEMIRKHGVGAKLKRVVMAERGWRQPAFGSGDNGDWYRNWPTFVVELEAAIREAKGPARRPR